MQSIAQEVRPPVGLVGLEGRVEVEVVEWVEVVVVEWVEVVVVAWVEGVFG